MESEFLSVLLLLMLLMQNEGGGEEEEREVSCFLHENAFGDLFNNYYEIPWEANDFGLVRMAKTSREGGRRSEVFVILQESNDLISRLPVLRLWFSHLGHDYCRVLWSASTVSAAVNTFMSYDQR